MKEEDDRKQFYEGKKKFWRIGTSINLVFFECLGNQGNTYIKITAMNNSDTNRAIANPLFLDTDLVRIIVEIAAAEALAENSKSLSVRRMSGKNMHPHINGHFGLSKYTLDLLAKFLFDRVIVSVPKIPTEVPVEFAIELMQLPGDKIASNGKLAFEIDTNAPVVPTVIVSENIAAFEKKTASFLESATECHSTYKIARNHSIACLKSIRNFSIMNIAENRRRSKLAAVKDFKPKTKKLKRSKFVKDSRFGSLGDSFVEDSEFLNAARDNDSIVASEKFNGAVGEKEAVVKGSDNQIIGPADTNSAALPPLKTLKSDRSMHVSPLKTLNSDRRMNLSYDNRRMSKIEEVANKIQVTSTNSSCSMAHPDTIKVVQVEPSDKAEILLTAEPEPAFTFFLPDISKTRRNSST
jgi:hypothetical protein